MPDLKIVMADREPFAIPAYISPDHMRGVDVFSLPGSGEDIHRAWLALADGPGLVWTPRNGDHWIATDGQLLLSLSRRTNGSPIGKLRFRPAAIEQYARRAREQTIAIIERLLTTGQCEFTGDYATILPLDIFLEIVDLPEGDRARLHASTRVMTHEADLAKRHQAFRNISIYLDEKIAERRASPGDDLLSGSSMARSMARSCRPASSSCCLPLSMASIRRRSTTPSGDVDFHRPAKASTTFGAGVHRCPGASLARLEMKIMEEWLRHIPDFEVDPTRPLVQSSGLANGILELPLRWPAAPSRAP